MGMALLYDDGAGADMVGLECELDEEQRGIQYNT